MFIPEATVGITTELTLKQKHDNSTFPPLMPTILSEKYVPSRWPLEIFRTFFSVQTFLCGSHFLSAKVEDTIKFHRYFILVGF